MKSVFISATIEKTFFRKNVWHDSMEVIDRTMNMTSELFNRIINTSQDCVFWKDSDRRFLGVNQAFLDYYGFDSVDVLLGKTDEDMGWHSDPETRPSIRVSGMCCQKKPAYLAGKRMRPALLSGRSACRRSINMLSACSRQKTPAAESLLLFL